MNENKEIRMLAENFRAVEDDKMIVEGYAVVFDTPGVQYFTEIIDSNAFNGCDMKDVPLKYNHDDNHLVLARTRNESLQLTIDDKGLKIRAELIDTQSNVDIYKMIKAGLLDKMSFAFTVSEETWDYETDTRTVLKIDKLYDVSVVDTPWYDATSIYARAMSTLDNGKKDLEKLKEQKELRRKKLQLKIKLGGM
jgi:HK97 family phage prohead protease